MNRKPHFVPPSVVAPLPRNRRRFLFLSLLFIFICAVPVFVFYANGYRYDFWAEDPSITATGGLYVSVGIDDGEVFLNNAPVQDSRVFRSALYIQGLLPGLQRLHVQAAGYHTWVKELPVYAHIVTEASAFLLPERPYLRPITEYQTSTGTPVYLGIATSTTLFSFASTSVPIIATTSRATTTLVRNSEYQVLLDLFGTTTATTTTPLINRVVDNALNIFTNGTTTASTTATTTIATSSTATTTIIQNDTIIFQRDDDIYVRYQGQERNIPYYFCIPDDIEASSSPRFEAQLIEARRALAKEIADDASVNIETTTTINRDCRREIKIDRAWQTVKSFYFFPGTTDLVVIHRDDGVYVTEVDDRAWQNSQRIYPESADAVIVNGNRIFVRDDEYFFEILTELPTE